MSCATHPDAVLAVPCSRCGLSFCDDCLMLLRGARLCVSCKSDTLRDLISGTSTERKPLARIPLRISAYLLDRGIFYALLIGVATLQAPLRRTQRMSDWQVDAVVVSLTFAVSVGFIVYEALMLAARGQTLGKMAAKVRVVRIDGTKLRRWQAWARALVRSLCASSWMGAILLNHGEQAGLLMLLGIINPLVAVFTPERTALHDLLCRTRTYRIE